MERRGAAHRPIDRVGHRHAGGQWGSSPLPPGVRLLRLLSVAADDPPAARLRVRRVIACAVVVAVLGGFALVRTAGGGSEKPVADAEARRYLDRIVAAAQARDWEKLCHLSAAVFNCRLELDTAGRDAPPPGPPLIVASP